MKNALLISLFCSLFAFPQGGGAEAANRIELFLGIYNSPHPNSYTFYLENVGTVWATNNDFNPPGFFINEDPEINASNYPWYVRDLDYYWWRGWNMVYSQDQQTIVDTLVPTYAYGLYKMSTNASNAYFYIDYRDARIPYTTIPSNKFVDHWIVYDFNNNTFSYTTTGEPYTPITNGEYLRFWDEIQETIPPKPSTSEFPDYWKNCLAAIDDNSGYPTFVWGPHPDDNINIIVTGYNIYRAISTGNPPPNPNYVLIATVDAETFEYTDTQYALGSIINLHYIITATYTNIARGPTHETSPTNTIIVGGAVFKSNPERLYSENFTLSQNYPNPFNPITTIIYSIKESGLVTLKVFDIIGNEVATLVNENKQAGKYSVEFNAKKLPSGIYFYKLTAKKFISAKKLILLK